jgi:hypothetical protein
MKRSVLIAAACAAVLFPIPALAQASSVQELVVTASKRDYDPLQTPQVVLPKRADNLITKVTVVCDTREPSKRRDELKATLLNMIRAARKDGRISLGVGDEVVGDFNETMLDKVIEPDPKADTSRAMVLVKTAVTPTDTFDGATSRIKAFVEKTPKDGRTEILLNSSWDLTLIDPNQYRPQIAGLVADDAKRMAALFGEGYGVEVEGLQLPVSWYQSGPLDLALYLPYRLNIRPKAP